MDILVKLLIAHLIADFFLQWPALLESKNTKKFLAPYLYLHVLIHGALSLAILWDISMLPGIAAIMITHAIFDGLKSSLQNKNNSRLLFFIDQVLHVAVLLAVANYYSPIKFSSFIETDTILLHLMLIILITRPSSIMIKTVFTKWQTSDNVNESLSDAGEYIGYLERLLIYIAIIIGQWGIIGFLLASKSVFRFNDIKEKAEIKFTEYVFVGTLLSFAFAIAAGLTFNLLYLYI